MGRKLFTRHPYSIDIWMCTTVKDFKFLNKKLKHGVKIPKHTTGFVTYDMGNKPMVICVLKKDLSVVAHECYHAVSLLSNFFELTTTVEADEPNAYLIGAMVSELSVLAKLKRKHL